MPFEQIPILTKALVRHHRQEILAEGTPKEFLVEKMTSGSTGEPMVFYRDLSSGYADLSAKAFLNHLHQVPDEVVTVHIAAPRSGRTSGDPSVRLVPTTDLTRERLEHELALWQEFPSYMLYGYASTLEWIAEQIEQQGLSVHQPPACVITTADLLTRPGKQHIERVMRCPVHSWYGSNEMGGYLAGTVPGSESYLFNPFVAYVEILDDVGKVVQPGTVGRLIVTHLSNYAFPLIRYDTGDRAMMAPIQHAGGFFVVEQLAGRSSEQLYFPSGKVLTAVTLGNRLVVAPALGEAIRLFQCAQIDENELELRIVWNQTPTPELRQLIVESLRTQTDHDTRIRIKDVEALLTLPSGKRWILRDERRKA